MPSVFCGATSKVDSARNIYRVQRCAAVVLVALVLAGATQPALAEDPPPVLAAEWSRSVWDGKYIEFPFSGFRGEGGGTVDFQNSRVPPPNKLPLTAAYAKRYQEIRDAASQGRDIAGLGACSSLGVPVILGLGPMEILFSKDRVTMLWEDGSTRRIYTDGRAHPADPEPRYLGHSIGHWDGRTLVIDTIGVRDDTLIETGMPHSDKMHMVERWTQTKPDTMEIDITVTDPVVLTAPLRQVLTMTRQPGMEILEYFCTHNHQQKVDGATTLIGFDGKPLTGPPPKP